MSTSRITRSNVTGLSHETGFEQSAMAPQPDLLASNTSELAVLGLREGSPIEVATC
jgi:hypothetical protein